MVNAFFAQHKQQHRPPRAPSGPARARGLLPTLRAEGGGAHSPSALAAQCTARNGDMEIQKSNFLNTLQLLLIPRGEDVCEDAHIHAAFVAEFIHEL